MIWINKSQQKLINQQFYSIMSSHQMTCKKKNKNIVKNINKSTYRHSHTHVLTQIIYAKYYLKSNYRSRSAVNDETHWVILKGDNNLKWIESFNGKT